MSPAVRSRAREAAGRTAPTPTAHPFTRLGPFLPPPTSQALAWRAALPAGRAGLAPTLAQGDALTEWVLQAMAPAELLRLLHLGVLPTATGADQRLGRVVAEELLRRLGEACRQERGRLTEAELGASETGAGPQPSDVNGLLAQAQRAALDAPLFLGSAEVARQRAVAAARRALHVLHDNDPGRPRELATLLSVVRCLSHLPSAAHDGLASATLEALQLLAHHPTLSPFRLTNTPAHDAAWLREQLQPVVVEAALLRGDAEALARAAGERGPWLARWLDHEGAADWASVALARGQAPLLALLRRLSAPGAVDNAVHVYLHEVQQSVNRAQAAGPLSPSVRASVVTACTTCLQGLEEDGAETATVQALATRLLAGLQQA